MNRAERRRRTEVVVARRIEEMRWTDMFEWIDDRYIGRCRNRSPFDCGRPRCGVCGWTRKHVLTRQEKAAKLAEE